MTARRRAAERKIHTFRGHCWGFCFATALAVGASQDSAAMCAWASVCFGIAIFFWYKAETV